MINDQKMGRKKMKSFLYKRFLHLVVLLMVFLFSMNTGFALIARSSETVIIESEEMIDENLYVVGDTIIIDGTVNGSLTAIARTIIIRGRVDGTVLAIARTMTISGDVGQSLKAAAQKTILEGDVGGDLLLAGGRLTMSPKAEVRGDFLFAFRLASVEGLLRKDLIGAGRSITIGNEVKGNVKLAGKDLTLTSRAKIGGDFVYLSENEATVQSGAQILGDTTQRLPEYKAQLSKLKWIFPFLLLVGIVGKVASFFMALVVGLVFILLLANWLRSLADSIQRKPGQSAGWGAVVLFAAPVGIAAALISIVGIPLGVIALFLYLIALYLCRIVVGLFLGRLIIRQFGSKTVESKALLFGSFVLGLFILDLFRLIPVFGYLVSLATVLFGLGAIVVAAAGLKGKEKKAAVSSS